MEAINSIFEASSMLIDDLSSRQISEHQDIIRKYIEIRILNVENIIPQDFKSGLDWINVSKELSFAKELKGKVVVLDFFTYCCINCMHILPQLKSLEHNFKVEDGLVVIGVHSPKFPNEHSTSNVEAAVKRYEITHPVVNDHEEHLWSALAICCWPTLVIIGPSGQLLLYLMGESHEQLLNSFVRETLFIMNAKGDLSSHAIPEIGAHQQFRGLEPLCFPGKVCVTHTASGHLLALTDTGHHRVLVVDSNGLVTHVIGGKKSGFEDGSFEDTKFHAPQGIVFADSSTLYVADTENHAIRKIDLRLRVVETVVGDGTQGEDQVGGGKGKQQRLSSPWDLTVLTPSVLLVAMAGCHQLWAYFLQDTTFWRNKQYTAGSCAAVAGSGREENRNNSYPQSAAFAQPSGLSLASDKGLVYVADSESSTVRSVSIVDGKVSAVVGGMQDPQNLFAFGDVDGTGLEARLQHPLGVAWSDHKQALYVCDSYNHKVKVINPATRHCSTLTGNNLAFNEPGGLCTLDNLLYVADTNNHCLKIINLNNHFVQTLVLKFKKSQPSESIVQPVQEVQVSVNSKGGDVELTVHVQVSADIKPLPESPAVWSLTLPEGWKETSSKELQSLQKHWTLTAPAASKEPLTNQLKVQCRLFYCHNNLCAVKNLPFLIRVVYSDCVPSTSLCSLKYNFSL